MGTTIQNNDAGCSLNLQNNNDNFLDKIIIVKPDLGN